jgi:uncharacterized membrane protein
LFITLFKYVRESLFSVVTLGVVAGWLAGLVISGGGLYHWQHNRWGYRQLLGGWFVPN